MKKILSFLLVAVAFTMIFQPVAALDFDRSKLVNDGLLTETD